MMPAKIGVFYTINEAQDILGLRPSEFKHEVEQQKITCNLKTQSREFLLFQYLGSNNWRGLATCQYSGHIAVSNKLVNKLLDVGKSPIGGYALRLLDPKGITSYKMENPFDDALPLAPLNEWADPLLNAFPDISKTFASTMPTVNKHIVAQALDMWEKVNTDLDFEKLNPNTDITRKDLDKLHIDFTSGTEFTDSDLRVSGDHINLYSQPNAEENETTTSPPPSHNTRENQLHSLIIRVLIDHPEARAKAAWRILENESTCDTPKYDSEGILIKVDSIGIDWVSRHGTEQTLTRASFDALVSKLRKEINQK